MITAGYIKASQNGKHQSQSKTGTKFSDMLGLPYAKPSTARFVDEPDAGERHDHSAEAVDQQIAAKHRPALTGLYCTPRSASGTSAMMISALKITAARTALWGECSPMMLSFRAPDTSP